MRVSPDFKSREIVATGIRFPVGIALQQGRRSVLHGPGRGDVAAQRQPVRRTAAHRLKKGRHYGFPPRHPKHLPDVIDEPSTFDYGPQHQSTCGFCFNEPVKEGGPTFGPKAWAGDVIVTGESRGKLYRTQLVKTDAGYVAKNQTLRLPEHAHDRLLRRAGRLAGGRVPQRRAGLGQRARPARGSSTRSRYTDTEHPQPVLVYPTGPREVRVEFDRPVDPQLLRDVLAADEAHRGAVRPGRRPLRDALAAATRWCRCRRRRRGSTCRCTRRNSRPTAARWCSPPTRSRAAVHYALTLPGMGRPAKPREGRAAAARRRSTSTSTCRGGGDLEQQGREGARGAAGCRTSISVCRRTLTAGSAHSRCPLDGS